MHLSNRLVLIGAGVLFLAGALLVSTHHFLSAQAPTIQMVIPTARDMKISYYRVPDKYVLKPSTRGSLRVDLWFEYYEVGQLVSIPYRTTREVRTKANEAVTLWVSLERFEPKHIHTHIKLGGQPVFPHEPEAILEWREWRGMNGGFAPLREKTPLEFGKEYTLLVFYSIDSLPFEEGPNADNYRVVVEKGHQVFFLKAVFSMGE